MPEGGLQLEQRESRSTALTADKLIDDVERRGEMISQRSEKSERFMMQSRMCLDNLILLLILSNLTTSYNRLIA